MRQRWIGLGGVAALLVARIAWVGWAVVHTGGTDHAAPADAVVVLGAAVVGDQPSPVFAARLDHGITLMDQGIAPRLILTGGVGAGDTHAESAVGRSVALAAGIDPGRIWTEAVSRTTVENLEQAKRLLAAEGLDRVVIVSDPDHLYRARLAAQRMGLRATTSPTPTSRFRTWRTRGPFVAREIYFVHHDACTWGR